MEPAYGLIVISTHYQKSVAVLLEQYCTNLPAFYCVLGINVKKTPISPEICIIQSDIGDIKNCMHLASLFAAEGEIKTDLFDDFDPINNSYILKLHKLFQERVT